MLRRLKTVGRLALAAGIIAACSLPAWAASSLCDTQPGNLVQNCGFETGELAGWMTFGAWGQRDAVDDSYDFNNGFQGDPHSGIFQLILGNYEEDGSAGIQQILHDTPGATYQLSFWTMQTQNNPDDEQELLVNWNGANLLNLDSVAAGPVGATIYNRTQYAYPVVGTGADTLSIEGYSDHGYNHVDDFEMLFAAPEPGTLGLLAAGLLPMAAAIRRRRK